MADLTRSIMYEIPSMPNVFHVYEDAGGALIKYMYGDMTIQFSPKNYREYDPAFLEIITNRIDIIYVILEEPFFNKVNIYFTSEVDYAAALLTLD